MQLLLFAAQKKFYCKIPFFLVPATVVYYVVDYLL